MPSTCASFCARTESAASNTRPIGIASEVRARIKIGASAGFTFRYVGLLTSPAGSWLRAALIAACTSRAAASMLRLRSNWRTTVVAPSKLLDVISVTPAMRPNGRSSGVESEQLGQEQAADERDAERPSQLGAGSAAEGEGQAAEQRGHRRHHDRAEAEQARLVDRLGGHLALLALGVEREVDHHDRVL